MHVLRTKTVVIDWPLGADKYSKYSNRTPALVTRAHGYGVCGPAATRASEGGPTRDLSSSICAAMTLYFIKKNSKRTHKRANEV